MTESRQEQLRRWRQTRLCAFMWACNDDACDCHQPTIEKIAPSQSGRFPWLKVETLWAGTFHSSPDVEEWIAMKAELRKAAEKYGIPLSEKTLYGEIPVRADFSSQNCGEEGK